MPEPLLCYWCLLHGDSGQFGAREAATMVNGTAVCINHIDRVTPTAPTYRRREEHMTEQPNPPADGRNGRWVKIGSVGVDSASIGITDLLVGENAHTSLFRTNDVNARYAAPTSEWAGDWGTGIRFWAGFGDGGYDVWAWVVDYGEDDEVDERIAQITVTMIDADDLAHWRNS